MKEHAYHPIRKILVPTDFSPNAAKAVRYAASMATHIQARLILFHTFHIPVTADSQWPAADTLEPLSRDEKRLHELKKTVLQEFPGIEAEIATSTGFAVDEIVGTCDRLKADLIVMGTKGAHGLGEMLLGSNTSEVIAKASCPVLAVPEGAVPGGMRKIIFATNYADNDFRTLFLLTEIVKPWQPEIVVVHADTTGHLPEETLRFEQFKGQVSQAISYEKIYFNLLEGSSVEQAVNDFARLTGADIIAVSTRRRTLYEKLFGRSVTKKLAFHTEIPLLAFHTGVDLTS